MTRGPQLAHLPLGCSLSWAAGPPQESSRPAWDLREAGTERSIVALYPLSWPCAVPLAPLLADRGALAPASSTPRRPPRRPPQPLWRGACSSLPTEGVPLSGGCREVSAEWPRLCRERVGAPSPATAHRALLVPLEGSTSVLNCW